MAKDKALIDKAISIKGKKYVLVSDRIIYFNENYPDGSISSDYEMQGDMFIVKATVRPNVSQTFTGLSQAIIGDGMVNKTAALENAETSAVGRALAMMGIGVIESIASADEMNKAAGSSGLPKATEKQLNWIRTTAQRHYNTDAVDEAVEDLIGKPVSEINIKEVKSVVDRINADNEEVKTTINVNGEEIDVY
jgi:hypothetical protein